MEKAAALPWVEILKQISIGNRSAVPLFETISTYGSYFMALCTVGSMQQGKNSLKCISACITIVIKKTHFLFVSGVFCLVFVLFMEKIILMMLMFS